MCWESTPNDSDSVDLRQGSESCNLGVTPGDSNGGNVAWHPLVQNNGFENPKNTSVGNSYARNNAEIMDGLSLQGAHDQLRRSDIKTINHVK